MDDDSGTEHWGEIIDAWAPPEVDAAKMYVRMVVGASFMCVRCLREMCLNVFDHMLKCVWERCVIMAVFTQAAQF